MHDPVGWEGSRFYPPAFAQPEAGEFGHEMELGRPDVAELHREHRDPATVLERDQLHADPQVLRVGEPKGAHGRPVHSAASLM
jgi:hypothetical protein